jgi:hypothetical protein
MGGWADRGVLDRSGAFAGGAEPTRPVAMGTHSEGPEEDRLPPGRAGSSAPASASPGSLLLLPPAPRRTKAIFRLELSGHLFVKFFCIVH